MASHDCNSQYKYICIECCYKIKDIFKIYNDGFKDIIQCPNCNKLVDDYVECENSVILIDLILFNKKAYRHIIFNKRFENTMLLKFMITFLLCDAYLQWFHVKNRQFESIRSNDHQLFYELEWNFYSMLIRAIINHLIYSCIITSVCMLNLFILTCRSSKLPEYLNDAQHIYKCLVNLLFKSLTISSFGKLAVLPLVIWNPNEIFFNLALFFTLLTNSQALSVTTHMSRAKSLCLVFVAAGMAQLYTQIDIPIDDLFKN